MKTINNPRSTLHDLMPMGQGTTDVESLTSYFCRLAHSHGMTARNLAAWALDHYEQPIPDDFKWFRRSFAGMSIETEQWAVWLSELTGVANLDHLTLAPWRHLISNPSLTPLSDRWCPCCLTEDREREQSPYLRLSWDMAPLTACCQRRPKSDPLYGVNAEVKVTHVKRLVIAVLRCAGRSPERRSTAANQRDGAVSLLPA